jgi:hypothetical protein
MHSAISTSSGAQGPSRRRRRRQRSPLAGSPLASAREATLLIAAQLAPGQGEGRLGRSG